MVMDICFKINLKIEIQNINMLVPKDPLAHRPSDILHMAELHVLKLLVPLQVFVCLIIC